MRKDKKNFFKLLLIIGAAILILGGVVVAVISLALKKKKPEPSTVEKTDDNTEDTTTETPTKEDLEAEKKLLQQKKDEEEAKEKERQSLLEKIKSEEAATEDDKNPIKDTVTTQNPIQTQIEGTQPEPENDLQNNAVLSLNDPNAANNLENQDAQLLDEPNQNGDPDNLNPLVDLEANEVPPAVGEQEDLQVPLQENPPVEDVSHHSEPEIEENIDPLSVQQPDQENVTSVEETGDLIPQESDEEEKEPGVDENPEVADPDQTIEENPIQDENADKNLPPSTQVEDNTEIEEETIQTPPDASPDTAPKLNVRDWLKLSLEEKGMLINEVIGNIFLKDFGLASMDVSLSTLSDYISASSPELVAAFDNVENFFKLLKTLDKPEDPENPTDSEVDVSLLMEKAAKEYEKPVSETDQEETFPLTINQKLCAIAGDLPGIFTSIAEKVLLSFYSLKSGVEYLKKNMCETAEDTWILDCLEQLMSSSRRTIKAIVEVQHMRYTVSPECLNDKKLIVDAIENGKLDPCGVNRYLAFNCETIDTICCIPGVSSVFAILKTRKKTQKKLFKLIDTRKFNNVTLNKYRCITSEIESLVTKLSVKGVVRWKHIYNDIIDIESAREYLSSIASFRSIVHAETITIEDFEQTTEKTFEFAHFIEPCSRVFKNILAINTEEIKTDEFYTTVSNVVYDPAGFHNLKTAMSLISTLYTKIREEHNKILHSENILETQKDLESSYKFRLANQKMAAQATIGGICKQLEKIDLTRVSWYVKLIVRLNKYVNLLQEVDKDLEDLEAFLKNKDDIFKEIVDSDPTNLTELDRKVYDMFDQKSDRNFKISLMKPYFIRLKKYLFELLILWTGNSIPIEVSTQGNDTGEIIRAIGEFKRVSNEDFDSLDNAVTGLLKQMDAICKTIAKGKYVIKLNFSVNLLRERIAHVKQGNNVITGLHRSLPEKHKGCLNLVSREPDFSTIEEEDG